jgi:hypothetical protein
MILDGTCPGGYYQFKYSVTSAEGLAAAPVLFTVRPDQAHGPPGTNPRVPQSMQE